eukprot:15229873-Alexandrium_andersonii.AAC.1
MNEAVELTQGLADLHRLHSQTGSDDLAQANEAAVIEVAVSAYLDKSSKQASVGDKSRGRR